MGQSRKLFWEQGYSKNFSPSPRPSISPSVWQSSQSPYPFRILILFRINKFLSRATDFIWFHCWVGFIFVNPEFYSFVPRPDETDTQHRVNVPTWALQLNLTQFRSLSIWGIYKSKVGIEHTEAEKEIHFSGFLPRQTWPPWPRTLSWGRRWPPWSCGECEWAESSADRRDPGRCPEGWADRMSRRKLPEISIICNCVIN